MVEGVGFEPTSDFRRRRFGSLVRARRRRPSGRVTIATVRADPPTMQPSMNGAQGKGMRRGAHIFRFLKDERCSVRVVPAENPI